MFFGLDSLLRVVFPIIQSLKYLKSKDVDGINSVLKYWCLNWILSFLENIAPYVLNEIVAAIVILLLNVFLIYDKFRGSNMIFNLLVTPLMEKYNVQLQEFFNFVLYYEVNYQIESKVMRVTQETFLRGKQQLQEKVMPEINKKVAKTIVGSFNKED